MAGRQRRTRTTKPKGRDGAENMGRHEPEEYDPAAFADEAMGTAREMTARWYDREIAWRQRLQDQYQREVEVLIRQRAEFVRPEADTGANPLPAVPPGEPAPAVPAPEADPNATQAMPLAVEGRPEESASDASGSGERA